MISNRKGVILAVLIVLLAVMVALLASGGDEPDPDDGSSAPTTPATTPAPTPAPTQTPVDAFCAAFNALAVANNEHLAKDTPETHDAVTEAGRRVLLLAPDTDMSVPALQALAALVDGAIGVPAEPASAEAEAELETFMTASCPAGS